MNARSLSPYKKSKIFKKQLFKKNPAVVITKNLWLTAIYDRQAYPMLRSLLQAPDEFLSSAASQIIKHDRTSSLFTLTLGHFQWVVKRYNFKGWWFLFKRCFRISRARRSFIYANVLQQVGIPTIKPLAFLEKRIGCLRIQSYFISEKLEGIQLCHYFASDRVSDEQIAVADQVIALLKQLAQNAIHHGDLKATNIILHNKQPILLDLDVMRIYPNPDRKRFKKSFSKDIQRFMKNWRNLPNVERLFATRLAQLNAYQITDDNIPHHRRHHNLYD